MNQTIFGTDRTSYQRNLRTNILLCIFAFCAVAFIHIVCTLLRTDQNHTAMLVSNIAADMIGGSFLIARLSMCVFPQQKLLKLYDLATQEATGQVVEMGTSMIHYIGVNCYEVSLPDRRLFLPAHTMVLTVGRHYHFQLKGNLIVEVSCDAQ